MTAHAMRGDREHCLEKGMDDYVPKPVQAKQLLEAIERQLGKGGLPRGEVLIPDRARAEEIFEKGMLWERLGGDAELFEEIIGVFLDDAPLQMGKLQEALEKGDSREVELQAHSLKGAAMNIGGTALQGLAHEIENKGKIRDLDCARPLLSELEAEFEKLKLVLKRKGVQNPKDKN
jgi:HPt (histidine-containing phosphotransfer) domain-containing protein